MNRALLLSVIMNVLRYAQRTLPFPDGRVTNELHAGFERLSPHQKRLSSFDLSPEKGVLTASTAQYRSSRPRPTAPDCTVRERPKKNHDRDGQMLKRG